MLIRTLNLEKRGKKAYREENSSDEDPDMGYPNRFCQRYPELAAKNQVCDDSQDVMYMGGANERGNKRGSNNGRGKQKQGCLDKLMSMGGSGQNNFGKSDPKTEWENMSQKEQDERVDQLWQKARRYNNKLRFQARLQKMAESNLKEMMIDDINEDANEDSTVNENQPKLKWYLIDTERTFCKVWNFLITILTIYSMFVAPFVIVFPDVYQNQDEETGKWLAPVGRQQTLQNIERAIDIIYLFEIILNFVKRTRALKKIQTISVNYLTSYFIFDVVGTIPNLIIFKEEFRFYWLKVFRLIHFMRLVKPLELLLGCILQKHSKKRQNDLTSFCSLILGVIYVSHVMGCIWLWLGQQSPCKLDPEAPYDGDNNAEANCTASWKFAAGFENKSYHTQYIFAFYWIFEVITTVGYGDYTGATSQEYIFSIILEFLGLTFFSFLMGSINGIFNTSDNFDDLIEDKLDSLDMWIKKIEKSNKPFHIQPTLYNDIRKYVEQAFMYDFNLVIEEFVFYQQITPKMQTELIQNTRVFQEFEKSFNHFFDECERGFTNELIINMFCRLYTPGKTVISYKSNVKEMYFIRQGIVEVYNNDNDEIQKEKPILYLPKFSYFGDYQILKKLKSNIVIKTLQNYPNPNEGGSQKRSQSQPMESLPDIIFMCVNKDKLDNLCDLFPQTADNIERKALERRKRFMAQKNTNSKRYFKKIGLAQNPKIENLDIEVLEHYKQKGEFNEYLTRYPTQEDKMDSFYSDEEAENSESQKEDMKIYLSKLNKKIDILVEALKDAEGLIKHQTDRKQINELVKQDAQGNPIQTISISKQFNESIQRKEVEQTENGE